MTKPDDQKQPARFDLTGPSHALQQWVGKATTRSRIIVAAATVVVVALAVTAGARAIRSNSEILKSPVVVGVSTDAPGMGYQDPRANRRSGFDVDFYRWLGDEEEFNPTETDLNADEREDALREGRVDLVFASYTITDEREKLIDFAGPYLETFQGVMVRADDPVEIATPERLGGKSVCARTGSTSIAELRAIPGVIVVEQIGLGECVSLLLDGSVRAVSTDQLLLYGYARQDQSLSVLEVTFGALQKYGIGLPPQDGTENCKIMTERVQDFIISGAWEDAFLNNFGGLPPTEFKPDPNKLRGCIEDEES